MASPRLRLPCLGSRGRADPFHWVGRTGRARGAAEIGPEAREDPRSTATAHPRAQTYLCRLVARATAAQGTSGVHMVVQGVDHTTLSVSRPLPTRALACFAPSVLPKSTDIDAHRHGRVWMCSLSGCLVAQTGTGTGSGRGGEAGSGEDPCDGHHGGRVVDAPCWRRRAAEPCAGS